jgi:hypothetical protein
MAEKTIEAMAESSERQYRQRLEKNHNRVLKNEFLSCFYDESAICFPA